MHLVIQQEQLRLMCGTPLMVRTIPNPTFQMITDTRSEVTCKKCLRSLEMARPRLATVDGARV